MIVGGALNRRLIFQGNSLLNLHSGTLVPNGHYLSKKIYSEVIAIKPSISSIFLSINGNPTTTMNANFDTLTAPFIRPNDVVLLWEITNDLSVNGLTGAQAYDQVVIYCGKVRALGGKVAVGTFIARNHTADASDLFTRGQDCNTLLRANWASFCDLLCDPAVDPVFDEKTDANNTTYYQSDRLHLTTVGSDYIAPLFSSPLIASTLLDFS